MNFGSGSDLIRWSAPALGVEAPRLIAIRRNHTISTRSGVLAYSEGLPPSVVDEACATLLQADGRRCSNATAPGCVLQPDHLEFP